MTSGSGKAKNFTTALEKLHHENIRASILFGRDLLKMTMVTELADFVSSRKWEDLSASSQRGLKIRTLDALGCAFGALDGPPVTAIARLVAEFDGGKNQSCTLIGRPGSRSAPDRATLFNGALVRYLDFNDSFLAKGETCHPSDNVAPVLSTAEYSDASGKEFLLSLGIAY